MCHHHWLIFIFKGGEYYIMLKISSWYPQLNLLGCQRVLNVQVSHLHLKPGRIHRSLDTIQCLWKPQPLWRVLDNGHCIAIIPIDCAFCGGPWTYLLPPSRLACCPQLSGSHGHGELLSIGLFPHGDNESCKACIFSIGEEVDSSAFGAHTAAQQWGDQGMGLGFFSIIFLSVLYVTLSSRPPAVYSLF